MSAEPDLRAELTALADDARYDLVMRMCVTDLRRVLRETTPVSSPLEA